MLPAPAAVLTNAAVIRGARSDRRACLRQQLRDSAQEIASLAAPMRAVAFDASRRKSYARGRPALHRRRREKAFIGDKRRREGSAAFARAAGGERRNDGATQGAHRAGPGNRGATRLPSRRQKRPAVKVIRFLSDLSASGLRRAICARSAALSRRSRHPNRGSGGRVWRRPMTRIARSALLSAALRGKIKRRPRWDGSRIAPS